MNRPLRLPTARESGIMDLNPVLEMLGQHDQDKASRAAELKELRDRQLALRTELALSKSSREELEKRLLDSEASSAQFEQLKSRCEEHRRDEDHRLNALSARAEELRQMYAQLIEKGGYTAPDQSETLYESATHGDTESAESVRQPGGQAGGVSDSNRSQFARIHTKLGTYDKYIKLRPQRR